MSLADVRPDSWTPPLIVVAGAGVRFEDFIVLYRDWLLKAEVVVTSESLANRPELTDKEVMIIKSPVHEVIRRITEASSSRLVLVLASGDPLFFGIGATLAKHLPKENLLFLPNVSVVQYFFSKIGRSWSDVHFVSLHGRENREFFFWLRQGEAVVFFTDDKHDPAFIAGLLIEYGFSEVEFVVGERLGMPEERIVWGKVEEIADGRWQQPNIVGVFPGKKLFNCLSFRDDDLYIHQKGLITKREIRAIVLGALCLMRGHVLWDLGAGSGSVSIEACSTTPLRAVYAVEKDRDRYRHLLSNVKEWGCGEIVCVHGDAVELIEDLPIPDRIFIGGAGKVVEDLLEAIEKRCGRLVPVVLTCVTFSTLYELERYARRRNHYFEAFQINVSRALPIVDSHRFESLNPVWVVRLGFS